MREVVEDVFAGVLMCGLFYSVLLMSAGWCW